MRISLINILILIFTFCSYSLPKRAITVDDLLSFGRISDYQISPDGKTIAFVLTYQLKIENKDAGSAFGILSKENIVKMNENKQAVLVSEKSSPRMAAIRVILDFCILQNKELININNKY